MDEELRKQALGEVLASELKVMNEQLSVLPSMQKQLTNLNDRQDRMEMKPDVVELTVRKHSTELAEIKTIVGRLEPLVQKHDQEIRELKRKAG